jgi:hypothetical protein
MAHAKELTAEARERLEKDFEEMIRFREEVVTPMVEDLMAKDPGLPYISAYIQAQDLAGMPRADEAMERGEPWFEAIGWLGSYARLEWLKQRVEDGTIPREEVYEDRERLCDLWRGSDPDDTDQFWLEMWEDAFTSYGGMVTDEGNAPEANEDGYVTLYRGDTSEMPSGIAWSTNRDVALKFANTGGGRAGRADGHLFEAHVHIDNIYAYITGRNEFECIINPIYIEWLGEYELVRVEKEES